MNRPITRPVSSATPTQTVYPWRATARTVFAFVVALATLLPYVVTEANIPVEGVVAQALTVAGGVTRVLALPRVNAFITEWVPWLAPAPRRF